MSPLKCLTPSSIDQQCPPSIRSSFNGRRSNPRSTTDEHPQLLLHPWLQHPPHLHLHMMPPDARLALNRSVQLFGEEERLEVN